MDEIYQVDYSSTKDLEMDYVDVFASLIIIDEDDNETSIGGARIYLFNTDLNGWFNSVDSADSISGDVMLVMEVLNHVKEKEGIYGLIAVIDHLEIEESYRGKGYGEKFLEEIVNYLEFINVNYIGLLPVIFLDNKYAFTEKTKQFYIEKGFKPFVLKLGDNPVMGYH